jgi:hypothetical protein
MSGLLAPGLLVLLDPMLPHGGHGGAYVLARIGTQLTSISVNGLDQLRNGPGSGGWDIQLDRVLRDVGPCADIVGQCGTHGGGHMTVCAT